MPTQTTLRMGRPVAPSHFPLRTQSLKSRILSSTANTSGTTLRPSTSTTWEKATESRVSGGACSL